MHQINQSFYSLSLHSNLIISILSQVLHPWRGLVPTPVNNLQIPNLESRHCEKGNFELYVDRHFLVVVSLGRLDCGQLELCIQHVLLVPGKLLNGPFQGVVLWHVDCAACGAGKLWVLYVLRHWDKDVHIVGDASLLIVALYLDQEPDLSTGGLLDNNIH